MRPVVAAALVLVCARAEAHPLAFGLLELRDGERGRVDVSWRFSGTDLDAGGAWPVLPPHCARIGEPQREGILDGVTGRWRLDCGARGLGGAVVAVRGVEGHGVQVVVRHVGRDGDVSETILDDGTRVWTIPETGDRRGVFARYLALGVEHIATGWDHLAFVLGLCLLVRNRRALVASITAFTAGHSVTLALATLGVLRAPVRVVEAAIAWSIVVVAREAALRDAHDDGTPWAMAALFGLLHGFGFAGALAEVGLARDAIARALVAFNVGVELGQLAFVALALTVAAVALRAGVPEAKGRRALRFFYDDQFHGLSAVYAKLLQ